MRITFKYLMVRSRSRSSTPTRSLSIRRPLPGHPLPRAGSVHLLRRLREARVRSTASRWTRSGTARSSSGSRSRSTTRGRHANLRGRWDVHLVVADGDDFKIFAERVACHRRRGFPGRLVAAKVVYDRKTRAQSGVPGGSAGYWWTIHLLWMDCRPHADIAGADIAGSDFADTRRLLFGPRSGGR